MPTYTIETLANNALIHARNFVLDGQTQLFSNNYDRETRIWLSQAIADLRLAASNYEPNVSLETSNKIKNFEHSIIFSIRSGLGNCGELAALAFDYIAKVAPSVNVEICHILGGNHAFVVIGRDFASDLQNPISWGSQAVICDPWANDVFSASEYLEKLKNYYPEITDDDDYINHVENFNPEVHRFEILLSIQDIENNDSKNAIMDFFAGRIAYLYDSYSGLAGELQEIANRLENQYGQNDPKFNIVTNKINLLNQHMVDLSELSFPESPEEISYLILRQLFESNLTYFIEKYVAEIFLNETELRQLQSSRHAQNAQTFFNSSQLQEENNAEQEDIASLVDEKIKGI